MFSKIDTPEGILAGVTVGARYALIDEITKTHVIITGYAIYIGEWIDPEMGIVRSRLATDSNNIIFADEHFLFTVEELDIYLDERSLLLGYKK